MANTINISDAVKNVLSQATIVGNTLALNGNLDRKLYLQVNEILEAAGGKWSKKEKVHIFTGNPAEILGLAVSEGEIIDKKQTFQEFFTPQSLANRIVDLAGIKSGMRVLEPSAGSGAIADEARKLGADVTCVELQLNHVKTLEAKGYKVIHNSFLEVTEKDMKFGFDAIVMNPPFANNQDIDHVLAAFEWLGKGGILVAVMSPGFTFGKVKKRAAFREFVERNGSYEELPEGTFKEAGTNVRTVLVTLRRE